MATVALVAAGVGCRAAQYAANASLWHDEALVTANVVNRTLAGLVGKLDYAQAAPPLFLFAERGLFLALGRNEYALRLVSLVCGIAALVLFAVLCWRRLPPPVAPWVTGFFALSSTLIWHSAEVKPYGGDVLVAVLLLFVALAWRRPRAPDSSGTPVPPPTAAPFVRLALLAAVASVAVWFSFPTVLVFGGLSLLVLPQVVRRARPGEPGRTTWQGLVAYAAPNLLFAGSFLLLDHYSIKPQHVPYLSAFWAADFPDYAHPWTIPAWLVREVYSLCDSAYRAFGFLLFFLAAAGVGGWRRWRRQGGGDVLAACLLPAGLAVAAAFLKQYPFNGNRLGAYLLPALFLSCGGGMVVLRDLTRERLRDSAKDRRSVATWPWRVAWAGAAAVILGKGLIEGAIHLAVPRSSSGARPVVAYVRSHRQPGEGLYLVGDPVGDPSASRASYVSPLSLAPLFYWPDPPRPWHAGMPMDLSQIPEPRFWVIVTASPNHWAKAVQPLVDQLRPYAVERTEARFVAPREAGAALLFEKVANPRHPG